MAILQVLTVLNVISGKYALLANWDAGWYASIVEHGYRSAIPPHPQDGTSNVAFFPGFPILAWIVSKTLGIKPLIATVVAAQLASIYFWTLFHRLLSHLKFRPSVIQLSALLLAVQPGAFYLVVGYSESLFLSALMGYVYYCTRGLANPRYFALAIVHGILMSATRYFGAVIAIYPLLVIGLNAGRPRVSLISTPGFRRSLLAAGLSLLGIVGFFLYCHLRFGAWSLYFQTVAIGWGGSVGLGPLFSARFWLTNLAIGGDFPTETGRILMMATVGVGIMLYRRYRKTKGADLTTLKSLALLSAGVLALTLAGTASAGWLGLVRYLLPAQVLMLPLLIRDIESRGGDLRSRPLLLLVISWVVVFSVSTQMAYVIRFAHGLNVA